MKIRTCVSPSGRFVYGIHYPAFCAGNFRENDGICNLGEFEDGTCCENAENFPPDAVEEAHADPIYEIINPFPFRGATYIIKSSADRIADNPSSICLPPRPPLSLSSVIRQWAGDELPDKRLDELFHLLPEPTLLALAANSTDPEDLVRIADFCCEFVRDPDTGRPAGLIFAKDQSGRCRPKIRSHNLMEVLANNIFLPDEYKEVMVLRPGVQGSSEIVGEWEKDSSGSHVYEYLRRNSYIPWGHYAANMADDAVRYRAQDIKSDDIGGMRHLYYQRTYTRLAEELGIKIPAFRRALTRDELEQLRLKILDVPAAHLVKIDFNATLWGWNFGFDYAASQYRLHASHQQIHQQYAMIPRLFSEQVQDDEDVMDITPYACGDLVAEFIERYRADAGASFFDSYIRAIRTNERMDGRKDLEKSLIVYEDSHVMVFVPKAQTSQWELQLMPTGAVGNILEADAEVRTSLDRAMRLAVQSLEKLGARMITHFECSKRIGKKSGQRLVYHFLPKLPYSPGSFTEGQLRWINGHYPEDFARACRNKLAELE